MIFITLVRPDDCGRCAAVHGTLEMLAQEYELYITEVDALSDQGQQLILQHGIMKSPGILVNDSFLAAGEPGADEFRTRFNQLNNRV